jgi:hypothetical protein
MMQNRSEIDLNPQFRRALALMEETKQHVFVTGRAGTRKSTLLGYFREHTVKRVVFLAPTGVAAVNIQKSQGKTFEKAVSDVGRGTFAHGQMYVALSRRKTLRGIVLKQPIKKSHILMDWRVVKFLTGLQYNRAGRLYPREERILSIEMAIRNRQDLEIACLKATALISCPS